MYALTKPHGPCRGSSGSDIHKQIKQNQNRDIKVSGQWRRMWVVLAMVVGCRTVGSVASRMRHAGQRQQARCMGVSPDRSTAPDL